MRLFALDYFIAVSVALAASLIASEFTGRISALQNLNQGQNAVSPLQFRLGDADYVIRSATGCIGNVTVRARESSVLGVFINASLRLSREDVTFVATTQSSFAFNPLKQLYESNSVLTLGDKKIGELKLNDVRPHKISILGFMLPADAAPITFSLPGPITIKPLPNNYFAVYPPEGVNLPTQLPSFPLLMQSLDFTIEPRTETSICTAETSLDMLKLETNLRGLLPLLPKGVNS